MEIEKNIILQKNKTLDINLKSKRKNIYNAIFSLTRVLGYGFYECQ